MNIFRFAFELFIIYMVYKLIFEFIIPIYRTTRQMKDKMNQMHQKMEGQNQSANTGKGPGAQKNETPLKPSHDYIDYEEIK